MYASLEKMVFFKNISPINYGLTKFDLRDELFDTCGELSDKIRSWKGTKGKSLLVTELWNT